MLETSLYPPIKRFLEKQGYAVKGEIKDCDIVALRGGDEPVVVELKTTFSLQLVLQGIDRQAITDAVYLGCPAPRRKHHADAVKLCRKLGLGLLIVTKDHVEAVLDPAPYQPRKINKRKTLLLKEFNHRIGDTMDGGSTTRAPRMTAYRQDVLRCAAYIDEAGASKISVIRQITGVSQAPTIFQRDVYGWFQRQERGIYGLSPKGENALVTFAKTIASLSCIPNG
jgi:hypothetical protein